MGFWVNYLGRLIFLSALGASEVVSANPFCAEVLKRFDPSKHLKTHGFMKGNRSGLSFSRDWNVKEGDHSLPFYIEFSFEPRPAKGRLLRMPGIFMLPSNQAGKPHVIRLNLNRDAEGNIIDVNLIEDVFAYLHRTSDWEDEFRLAIDEPVLVRKLNETIVEALRSTGWEGNEPVLITPQNRKAHISGGVISPYEDSLLVGISRPEFLERMISLNHEIQTEVLEVAKEFAWFKAIEASGRWESYITIESVPIDIEYSQRAAQPAASGVLYRFFVVLRYLAQTD